MKFSRRCNGFFLLAALTILGLYACVYQHHPKEIVYGKEMYIYRDGSQHPLTSLLALKINGDYIFGKGEVSWQWQPHKFVGSAHHGVQLIANPSMLNSGEVTTVRWTATSSDISMDILALYCPHNSSSGSFTDYWYIEKSLGLIASSKTGEAKIALYDVRVSCEFRMFSINGDSAEIVAISNKIDFIDVPLHLHLALTGVSSQMRVQWTARHPYTPVVFYGLTPTNLKYTATGTWRTYSNKDMCSPPANLTTFFLHPGYLYDVLLTSLKENTQYYYKCGGAGFKYSSIRTFTTSLVKGSPDSFKFAVYGDMDITSHPGAEATASLLFKEAHSLSFALHIGDISYASGLSYRWEEWMTMIEPYSSLMPYMVSVGNHDQVTTRGLDNDPSGNSAVVHKGSWHDSGGECGVPLHYRFHMPDNGNHLWWYSFDYGSAHFLQLSSEHDLSPGSPQHSWLRSDLMKVNSSTTPWKIVTIHRPMYTSQKFENEVIVGQQMQQDIEDILSSNKVDLLITAHNHVYERTCKIYRYNCDEKKGIVNIVVGTAGMQLDPNEIWRYNWSKYFEVNFGYGRVTINRTDLLWEFLRNKDAVVADYVRLKKTLT